MSILLLGVIFYPAYAEWSREREVIDLLEKRQLHYETNSAFGICKSLGITLFDRARR